jgi:hypothetical protein
MAQILIPAAGMCGLSTAMLPGPARAELPATIGTTS